MKYGLLVISLTLTIVANAQEMMTAEQLIRNSQNEVSQIPVAMYVSGWRDGVSRQLLSSAETLSDSGNDVLEHAIVQNALGRCLEKLQVADLIGVLRPRVLNGDINPAQISATAALLDVATELCQGSIEDALR